MLALSGLARRCVVLLLCALALLGPAAAVPRSALAATTISNCSNLAAVKTTLEAGGNIVINCGVVTLDFGSEIVIDSDTTIDGRGTTTLSGGGAHRVMQIFGSASGVTVTLKQLAIVDGYLGDVLEGAGVLLDVTNARQGALYLDHVMFSRNTANYGAAITMVGANLSDGSVMAVDTSFIDNTAATMGGAVMLSSLEGSNASFTGLNTTFSGNSTTGNGGAIAGVGIDSFVGVSLTNSTFSDNAAAISGGAIGLTDLGGNATLWATNTTFSGNTAAAGDVFFGWGNDNNVTATFEASILAGDSGQNCYNFYQSVITSNDYNLGTDSTCNLTKTHDQIVADPGLAPLANNGGPTQTQALLPDSPAIDAAGGAPCLEPTDQRGVQRPQDGDEDGTFACDSGAVERIGTVLLGTSAPPYQRGTPLVGAGSTFQVFFSYDGDGQTSILSSAVTGVVACNGNAGPTQLTPANGTLVWQPAYQRYQYVWKTDKRWPAGCRQLILTFQNGQELRLKVQIVRLPG